MKTRQSSTLTQVSREAFERDALSFVYGSETPPSVGAVKTVGANGGAWVTCCDCVDGPGPLLFDEQMMLERRFDPSLNHGRWFVVPNGAVRVITADYKLRIAAEQERDALRAQLSIAHARIAELESLAAGPRTTPDDTAGLARPFAAETLAHGWDADGREVR